MRCHNPTCPEPRKGHRYAADGIEVCLACAELNRETRLVTLDEFVQLSPEVQRLVGNERVVVQDVIGQFNRYKDDGAIMDRGA